jgi:hypothetical protein
MIRNQDIEFTARARTAGFRVVTSPGLKCRYSPPASFRRLVGQMYGNGVWVGRRLSAHGLRHVAPALFFGALSGAVVLGLAAGPPWPRIAAALGGAYLLAVGIASLAWLPRAGRGALLLPLVFVTAHGAYALGTYRGLLSRREGRGGDRASDRGAGEIA